MDQAAFAHQELFGTSENAVKVQIWTAVSTYLLVAIMKKELRLEQIAIHHSTGFKPLAIEKMPILEAFFSKYVPLQTNKAGNSCHCLINVGDTLMWDYGMCDWDEIQNPKH